MNKLRIILASVLTFLPLVFITSGANAQNFDPLGSSCEQVSDPSNSEICSASQSGENPLSGNRSIFVTVADILTIAAGAIAVVMIIIAGITMITSSGDPAKVKKGRDTIIYSVVGILVVLLSRSIVIFIVERLS